ncbi:MAG: hypothetical protein O3A14_17855 [Cyanobacteria bacterium]|nr:hypothetical protein [Cyanobacteriota bacterium]
MPSSEQLLTALWTLEPQLPKLLDPATVQRLQRQLEPVKQAMTRGESDGTDLVALISSYPSLQAPWQAALGGADPEASQAEMLAALDALLAESDGDTIPPPSTDAPGPEDDNFDDLGVLLMPQSWGGESKAYEGLAGAPTTAVPGRRYVCPVEGCSEEWFRVGLRQPPLCEVHGKTLIPDPASTGDGG